MAVMQVRNASPTSPQSRYVSERLPPLRDARQARTQAFTDLEDCSMNALIRLLYHNKVNMLFSRFRRTPVRRWHDKGTVEANAPAGDMAARGQGRGCPQASQSVFLLQFFAYVSLLLTLMCVGFPTGARTSTKGT